MQICIRSSCWKRSWNSCNKAKGKRENGKSNRKKAKGKMQKEGKPPVKRDIEERTFAFAVTVIQLSKFLPRTNDGLILSRQLSRSGTSIGANVEEAEAGYSKHEFAYKMSVALREAREAHYWLRLIKAGELVDSEHLRDVIREAVELKRILGSIVSKAREKRK